MRSQQTPRKIPFGGRVLSVDAKTGSFVMQGGGSKRYPRPRILHDKRTRWTGVRAKKLALKAGDSVRVEAVPEKDGAFRAVSIEVQAPERPPKAASFGKPGR
jgi:hypothetical protein